jgi:unsaturated rhamnogalacturonyl hydrolase
MHDYPEMWRMEDAEKIKWSYTKGLMSEAFLALWKETGDSAYFNYARAYADTMINAEGEIFGYKMEDYNIDNINPGKMLFELYAETGDPRYETAIHTLRRQLVNHPRTEAGGFWHKKRYPHQMWLDGLYMGSVFYARYGVEYNEPEDLFDAASWIILMEEKARDPKSGLLYHAWDESKEQQWASKETGLSENFWGRGMGWYAMAVVDILDYLGGESRRAEVMEIVNRLAKAIIKVQDPESGVWYQVLDMGDREGNYLEGSVSSMFTYFLLKAVKMGYIKESYMDNAKKAYQGILDNLLVVREDGGIVLTPVCAVAGLGGDPYRDGTYEYYINEKRRDNDPKGVGPFILASLLFEEFEDGIIATPGEESQFEQLYNAEWTEVFNDPCTGNWEEKWLLDGKVGYVENSPEGMALHAGPEIDNDSDHVVLWTKESFVGDLLIEYDYTRLDKRDGQVNIIYIQATGSGEGPFKKDIFSWNDLREIPSMATYYNNMNLLHISYAALTGDGDYIRARRYRPDFKTRMKGTPLGSAYNTGFFDTGVPHHIIILKKGYDLFMKVSNSEQSKLYKWNYQDHPPISEGPVGLRQMFSRSSLYKNFIVKELGN